MSTYPGIDYGMGTSNIDRATGLRFGIISAHSIMGEALDDFECDYGPATCPECGEELPDGAPESGNLTDVERAAWSKLHPNCEGGNGDHYCTDCDAWYWADACYGDEPIAQTYDRDGYQLSLDGGGDVWVLRSPYYTYAQYCSPCAPGAVHLDNPAPASADPGDGWPRGYCLGADWFDGPPCDSTEETWRRPCPYPYWRVGVVGGEPEYVPDGWSDGQ